MLHAYLYTICFVFCYTSWRFYAFFELTYERDATVPVPCFLLFLCFSEKLHRKYSRNWTKQKTKFLFFLTRDGVQSRGRGGSGASHTIGCRGPCHLVVGPPGPPPDAALPPIYSPRRGKPKDPISFPWNILQAAAVVDARLGGSRSSSRHPVGEGNHHQRPSSS
jgi:hypothetical protein